MGHAIDMQVVCCAALKRTAADHAVPPTFAQSTTPEKVAPKCNNWKATVIGSNGRPRGWPRDHTTAKINLRRFSTRPTPGVAAGDAQEAKGRATMPIVTWDHVHLRSPDPEATAAWLADVLGGVIIRGPGRIDVKLGGANVFIAPVAPGDGVNTPPVTPYQGLDHFGLSVKDIDAVAAEIKAKGVEFTKEPTTIRPGVRICFIRGPQGISVELLERDKKYA
jgi:catechol 2,3-dioxygenase-like lactoylglutathione lyase family enzyme